MKPLLAWTELAANGERTRRKSVGVATSGKFTRSNSEGVTTRESGFKVKGWQRVEARLIVKVLQLMKGGSGGRVRGVCEWRVNSEKE